MRFTVSTGSADHVTCDILALAITEISENKLTGEASKIDQALGGLLTSLVTEEGFKGKEGQITSIHTHKKIAATKIVLVGLGKPDLNNTDALRKMAALAAKQTRVLNGKTLCISLPPDLKLAPTLAAALVVQGATLGLYKFDRYKTKDKDESKGRIDEVSVHFTTATENELKEGLRQGEIVASSVVLARDLINESGSTVTATKLAEVATQIGKEFNLEVNVFDEKQITELKMNAYLAVNKGSAQPPRFIHMRYKPANSRAHVALVGKGITFDSGGLDLKTADGMLDMKCDMSGAAAVISTIRAIAQLKPAVTVDIFVAATDNMPGKDAYKPGDILVARNGKSMEIGNTDAEGRVTLADALSYAVEQNPDEVIDIATLTGACKIALGNIAAGVFGNDQGLIDRIMQSGKDGGEKMWQLPMFDEYADMIKSDFADIKNVGGRWGGASTAAAFLKEFVGETKWVHLDIAGPAWYDSEDAYRQKGGTGYGVTSLVNYVLSHDKED